MLYLNAIPYKTRIISFYVAITLLGIGLTLFAIYNASNEQLLRDHINNVHALFSDRQAQLNETITNLEQLPATLSTPHYQVTIFNRSDEQSMKFDNCLIKLSPAHLESQRLNEHGGITGDNECLTSWVILETTDKNKSLLILHRLNTLQRNAITAAYIERLLVPLAFFIWITIWGSLILGNLVKRLQAQKDAVEHLALHDTLTGLPNRQYFLDEITELVNYSNRKKVPFVLAMIDLNKFKEVNDSLGHQYGDNLLTQVALRLKDSIRDYDIVARLGGDEFVLLLPGTDIGASMKILERIYRGLILNYTLLDKQVQIGASIGVSYFPQHDITYTELVHKADIAMYNAKQSGGGIKVFDASMVLEGS